VIVALGTDDDEGVGVKLDVAPGSEEDGAADADGAAEADGASDGRPEGSPSLETNTKASAATTKAATIAAPSLRFMTQTYLCSIQPLKVETLGFTLAKSRAGM
jgi:hypothetical protein